MTENKNKDVSPLISARGSKEIFQSKKRNIESC